MINFSVGDIILYRANNNYHVRMLITKILSEELSYGIKYEVLMLDTGQVDKFILYPIDKYFVTKVA